MASTAQPISIDGVDYPSKTAAIVALHAMGRYSHAEIANKASCAVGSIGTILSQQRRKQEKAGVWTPEKRDKVRRLFGTTMIYIAEAVGVPPAELLRYVLHGVIPPSQKAQTIEDIRWRQDRAALPVPIEPEGQMLPREAFEQSDVDPPATLADTVAEYFELQEEPADHVDGDQFVEPSREDDEAELAALDALEAEGRNIVRGETDHPKVQEVAPPAPVRFPAAPSVPRKVAEPVAPTRSPATGLFPAGRIVRLVNERGQYLHHTRQGFTKDTGDAWDGTRQQFDVLAAQMPKVVAKLQFEVVP